MSRQDIDAYVAAERPLEPAGSFLIGGLGITRMDSLAGRDYTAPLGLPLIAPAELLDRFDVRVLSGLTNTGACA